MSSPKNNKFFTLKLSMNHNPSRRLFIRKSVLATTGLALLSTNTFANTIINTDAPFQGYNPYAEEKNDLRVSKLIGKHLTIKGKIFDETGTFTLPNTNIEVWHLSPNSKSFKHKAKLKTDASGAYSFITDFPNNEKGKPPRIYFKVSNKYKSYFTELIITDFDAHISAKHWEENNQLGDDKLFPIKEGKLNASTITFNISL